MKNVKNKLIGAIAITAILYSCSTDILISTEDDMALQRALRASSPTNDELYYSLPTEGELHLIPQDLRNELTPEKVELGKLLFYETGFARAAEKTSGMGTYSCSSCHIPEAGFRANQPQGVADGGIGYGINGSTRLRNPEYQESELDVQSARPLSLINVAYVTNTFWNGSLGSEGPNEDTQDVWDLREDTRRNSLGYDGIETVNFEGLFTHRILIDSISVDQLGYKQAFDEVFDNIGTQNRYSNFTGSLALSAYIRSITSYEAPFQQWLKGEKGAMTQEMKNGALLFFGKANCYACHYEPNLGSQEFHVLGVKDMYQRPSFNTSSTDRRNLGRGGFTLREEDYYKFKVPGLYNVGDSPFYFHGASKNSLEEVIDYKSQAQSENVNISQELISDKFRPLDLTVREKEDLITFIRYGLRDPDLLRYKPESVLSGQCFPNADSKSIRDIGCN